MNELTERASRKNKIKSLLIKILFVLIMLELTSQIWLNFIAPEEARLQYSLFSYITPDNQRFIRHHYLNYALNPQYRRGKTYHNSFGYRNKEFTLKKPQEIFRIVVLGGSTVYTIAVDDNEKTFTAILENILKNKYGYKNVEVINAGIGGYNSWETLLNLQFKVLDIEPDLVIEYEGANDVHARLVDPKTYRGDNSGRRKQWSPPKITLLEYSAFFRITMRKLGLTDQASIGKFVNADSSYSPNSVADHNPMYLLSNNPPVYFRRNLNNMAAIAKANNIDIMLATWAYSPHFEDYASTDYYQKGYDENNDVIKDVAKSNGIPLFDFASVMPKDKKYWTDGRHLNELGAEKKAILFAEFIHKNNLISN